MKFSAAVLVKTGYPLQIIDNIQIPQLKTGQVLVKVIFAGVCHSQLMEQGGHRGEDKYLPHLLGHEGTGVVMDVGKNVSKVKVGQQVILGWLKGEGIDAGATVYESPIGKINAGAVTTFSQLSVVSENRCYLLPNNISLREGVLLGCALPTGMGMVNNQINCQTEHSIGIFGLGGIGISALIAAVNCDAKLIAAIDTNADKLALAKKLGAHICINPTTQNTNEIIAQHTSGKLLDYIIEAAGSCKTIEQAFSLINQNTGKCVFASHPKHGDKICLDPFDLICGKKIEGSWGGHMDPERLIQDVAKQSNHDSLKELVANTYQLQDINQAMSDLRAQKVVRGIIEMESSL